MVQIFLKLTDALARLFQAACEPSEDQRWRADPLSHPALSRMSTAELADLPIGNPVLMREPCGS